ncbi:lymphocyte cytosolic protein 2a isoform 2-T2 [Pholidichthys leucotaenia]
MNLDRMPSKSEVMGWSPQQLADYLTRMNFSGCDKVVLRNSINGSRFVNLTENDLQKFPKLHAPMIYKLSSELSKKDKGPRSFFGKKSVPVCPEPVMSSDNSGWDEDEFDDDEIDDGDYESPGDGDDNCSDASYEDPTDDCDAGNDYEPPPTEPQEDHLKLTPALPIGDGEYIDNRNTRCPPVIFPRPPVSTLPPRLGGDLPFRRDPSPHGGGRPSGKFPPEPPKVFRCNKPGRDPGNNPSPIRGPHHNTLERPGPQSRRPQPEVSDPPSWSKPPVPTPCTSVSRSNSSARISPNRFDVRREQTPDEAFKHNTFPLHHKSLSPRPGPPGPPSSRGESLSLPHGLQPAMVEPHRGISSDRQSSRHPPPTTTPAYPQDLDPLWYVGKVTRGQAEGCLKRLHKEGAYLVRDSTRQDPEQPFTLMVFYQDKVFNIQIKHKNQQYMLGTGLKAQESFLSVSDIIRHYSQSALLLIDAKNRTSSAQKQCLLSEPAAYYMTGQSWS